MLLATELLVLVFSLQPAQTAAFHIPWRQYVPFLAEEEGRYGGDSRSHIQQDLALVQGVRKMSADEGEMFFPDYWTPHSQARREEEWWSSQRVDAGVENQLLELPTGNSTDNSSLLPPAQAAYAVHELSTAQPFSHHHHPLRLDFLLLLHRRALPLSKRDFQCPGGTSACTGIDRPNSCCPANYSCKALTGSPDGDVGCCAEGTDCGTAISECAADQTTCPGDQGGGCCLPGYTCAGVGCAAASTAVVTINPTVTASVSTSSSLSVSVSTAATTSTRIQTSSSSTTTAPPVVPVVRPTSGTVALTLTTTGPTTTYTPTSCPTGFYACSAHYLGGCCRVGRDCSSTSCPAPPSSLVLSTNGVSIGVAPAVTSRLGQDGCALGWFRCGGGDQGGGCCPSGFACGESCTATGVNLGAGVTGTAKVAKDNGNGGSSLSGSVAWILALDLLALGFVVANNV